MLPLELLGWGILEADIQDNRLEEDKHREGEHPEEEDNLLEHQTKDKHREEEHLEEDTLQGVHHKRDTLLGVLLEGDTLLELLERDILEVLLLLELRELLDLPLVLLRQSHRQ